MGGRVRTAVRVEGIVQGVGFRPFVYALATGLGLDGHVGNDAGGVFAEVEGPPEAVAAFLARLRREPPPLARIDKVTTSDLSPAGAGGSFVIAASRGSGARRALVSADTAPCPECLAELNDPADRRSGYPFINCTNCGPRFTIVRGVPYDRALTTMSGFAMCAACAAEYHDPASRRFHAQPVCCPDCGPRLTLTSTAGEPLPGDPVAATADLLRAGKIVAVKGLGGYHLAADARSEPAAAALRARKHREDKPFAVMVADLAAAASLCLVDPPAGDPAGLAGPAAAGLLTSPQRPIVLLPRRPGDGIAVSVAPGNRQLGVMLPYTPLHHLLLRAVAGPIVLTSGNVSDEPIAYDDGDARERLAPIADAFLAHDREIWTRTDDSVARAFRGRPVLLRRSRGYAPEPLEVPVRFTRPVLACGPELKNTFCLGRGSQALLSPHIGDLENAETLAAFTAGIAHYTRLFGVEPQVVAYDLHPEYLSTKYALALPDVELVGVQHHHAHIASCLADNGQRGPVIGVAFDGTGYGPDGTLWGGEFLIADLAGFQRAGHLAGVPLPGGAAAVRQPWRMAAVYLDAAHPGGIPPGLAVAGRHAGAWAPVLAMARRSVNAPVTTSAGRLFDAAAALLGVRDVISYEGQAAVELEQLAEPAEPGSYPAAVQAGPDGVLVAAGADLIRAAAADLAAGLPAAVIAARFHAGVAGLIAEACTQLRDRHGLSAVALSGGVFQNMLLTRAVIGRLTPRGFTVLTHSRVPCNDGGISLGQAVIAASRR